MFTINLPQSRGWWLHGWELLFEWNWRESCAGTGAAGAVLALACWTRPSSEMLPKYPTANRGLGIPQWSPAVVSSRTRPCLCSVLLRADTEAAQRGRSTHSQFTILAQPGLGSKPLPSHSWRFFD